jgi:hypothetical protein
MAIADDQAAETFSVVHKSVKTEKSTAVEVAGAPAIAGDLSL